MPFIVIVVIAMMFFSKYNMPTQKTTALTDRGLLLIIKPYQDQISSLKLKQEQIEKLKKTVDNLTYKVVKNAENILDKEGIDKALEYLQSISLKERMKEFSQKYKLEAQLLVIQDRYIEADLAYTKMLEYTGDAEDLFSYAHFLQKQNKNSEAILYYDEALKLYRALAQQNPSAYGIEYANTYLVGIYLLNKPKAGMGEVRAILEDYGDHYRAKQLLELLNNVK